MVWNRWKQDINHQLHPESAGDLCTVNKPLQAAGTAGIFCKHDQSIFQDTKIHTSKPPPNYDSCFEVTRVNIGIIGLISLGHCCPWDTHPSTHDIPNIIHFLIH